MTKEEAKSRLRSAGYKVVDDNSVVTVLIPADAKFDATLKDVREKLKTYGYEASFSIRQIRDAEELSDGKEEGTDTDVISDDADVQGDLADDAEGAASRDDADGADASDINADADAGSDPDGGTDGASEGDHNDSGDDGGDFFDDEDSDMILSENAVQFSLDDFGLDF